MDEIYTLRAILSLFLVPAVIWLSIGLEERIRNAVLQSIFYICRVIALFFGLLFIYALAPHPYLMWLGFLFYFLMVYFYAQGPGWKEMEERKENASPANAQIISLKESNFSSRQNAVEYTGFEIELQLEFGMVTVNWLVSPSGIVKLKVGEHIPVKIDKLQKEMVFPNVEWARYPLREFLKKQHKH